jgi:type VI secretion system ImpA family protein
VPARSARLSIATLRISEGFAAVSESPNFGQLSVTRPEYAATDETPLRIAVWGDFSGREGRESPRNADELRAIRGRKVTFDELDELIEELEPKLAFSVASGDEIELEFRELDDFHPDPIYKAADVFNRLADSREDKVGSPAALQMRELLRHPAYQALESAWRGLALLARRVAKDRRVQVVLYDVSAAELRADLTSVDDLAQTAFYDLLVTKSAAAPDGVAWGMIVGLYSFALSEEDAALLGRIAQVASHAGGPFLASMESAAAQRESYELEPALEAAWKALRALPEASFLALGTPGFLLRPPFGDNYRPPDSLPFEEFDGRPVGYLWGNPAVAAATLLALGFMEKAWGLNPAEKRVLDSMPVHAYRDEHDEDVGVVTEVRFTSAIGTELAKLGLIPVLSFKGRDLVELAAVRSVSASQPLLAGQWTGGGKVTLASPVEAPSESVNLQGGPAPKSKKVTSDDPEVDDALASLLAGDDDDADSSDDDDDSDSSSDDDSDSSDDDSDDDSPEESSDEESSDDDETDLDALLASLGGGDDEDSETPSDDSGDETADESAETTESEEEVDLDALLASLGGGDDDAETASDDSDGDSAEESTAAEEPEEETDLDALLASLGGDDDEASEESTEEAEPAAASDEDADLAALLAGDDDDSDSSDDSDDDATPSGSGDDDLDALLAGLGGDDDADSDSDDDADDDSDDDEDADSDEETSDDEEVDLDALLAGLGGDDEEAASDEESPAEEAASDEEETDLDALLASLGGDDDESETNETSDVTEPEAEAPSEEPSEEPEPSDAAEKSGAMDNEDLDAAIQATKAATKYGDAPNSTAPTIDFAALLKPISEDEPAGGSVPFDVRQKLDEMRREVNPADFAEDDPLRPEEPVRADWQGVIRLCQQTLTEKSKNLLIAARLTEALAKVHGFAGLRDGLHVFRQLINNCWDRLDPALDEDDDLEVRAAPFNWLDDPDRGAVFPNTIRGLPIVIAGGERYGALHWQLARENKQGLNNDMIEQAVFNASAEQCRHAAADSAQALQELKQLVNELRVKMGGEAPGLSYIRTTTEEAATLAKQVVTRKGGDEAPPAEETVVNETDGTQTVVVRQAPRAITRDDLYRQLNDAAAALQRMEPHSPVPYIVQRAVALGALPFPQLMMELIRDQNAISEMNRELGIKPAQSESEY